ncbi:unnamed protein product [Ostreobium quekettii]|uniref:Uncharacterized protein n=1 Tax=Ostreobium quekettii TaxID=121088 RepID=A0A8S1ISW9_9CHLO|nr:unnamed protein product [Ostreobium quekettii]
MDGGVVQRGLDGLKRGGGWSIARGHSSYRSLGSDPSDFEEQVEALQREFRELRAEFGDWPPRSRKPSPQAKANGGAIAGRGKGEGARNGGGSPGAFYRSALAWDKGGEGIKAGARKASPRWDAESPRDVEGLRADSRTRQHINEVFTTVPPGIYDDACGASDRSGEGSDPGAGGDGWEEAVPSVLSQRVKGGLSIAIDGWGPDGERLGGRGASSDSSEEVMSTPTGSRNMSPTRLSASEVDFPMWPGCGRASEIRSYTPFGDGEDDDDSDLGGWTAPRTPSAPCLAEEAGFGSAWDTDAGHGEDEPIGAGPGPEAKSAVVAVPARRAEAPEALSLLLESPHRPSSFSLNQMYKIGGRGPEGPDSPQLSQRSKSCTLLSRLGPNGGRSPDDDGEVLVFEGDAKAAEDGRESLQDRDGGGEGPAAEGSPLDDPEQRTEAVCAVFEFLRDMKMSMTRGIGSMQTRAAELQARSPVPSSRPRSLPGAPRSARGGAPPSSPASARSQSAFSEGRITSKGVEASEDFGGRESAPPARDGEHRERTDRSAGTIHASPRLTGQKARAQCGDRPAVPRSPCAKAPGKGGKGYLSDVDERVIKALGGGIGQVRREGEWAPSSDEFVLQALGGGTPREERKSRECERNNGSYTGLDSTGSLYARGQQPQDQPAVPRLETGGRAAEEADAPAGEGAIFSPKLEGEAPGCEAAGAQVNEEAVTADGGGEAQGWDDVAGSPECPEGAVDRVDGHVGVSCDGGDCAVGLDSVEGPSQECADAVVDRLETGVEGPVDEDSAQVTSQGFPERGAVQADNVDCAESQETGDVEDQVLLEQHEQHGIESVSEKAVGLSAKDATDEEGASASQPASAAVPNDPEQQDETGDAWELQSSEANAEDISPDIAECICEASEVVQEHDSADCPVPISEQDEHCHTATSVPPSTPALVTNAAKCDIASCDERNDYRSSSRGDEDDQGAQDPFADQPAARTDLVKAAVNGKLLGPKAQLGNKPVDSGVAHMAMESLEDKPPRDFQSLKVQPRTGGTRVQVADVPPLVLCSQALIPPEDGDYSCDSDRSFWTPRSRASSVGWFSVASWPAGSRERSEGPVDHNSFERSTSQQLCGFGDEHTCRKEAANRQPLPLPSKWSGTGFSTYLKGPRVSLDENNAVAWSQSEGAQCDFVISEHAYSRGIVEVVVEVEHLEGWAFVGAIGNGEPREVQPGSLAESPWSYGWSNECELYSGDHYYFESAQEMIRTGTVFHLVLDIMRSRLCLQFPETSRGREHGCHGRFFMCELGTMPRKDWRIVFEWLGSAKIRLTQVESFV